jgi:uncharacterized protein YndB with AHSA1/START domain
MTEQATRLTVRKTITVEASQEQAFRVFTEQIGSWWPLDTKTIGQAPAATAVLEPRSGGRWFERGVDGSECDWGRVVAYEPPERVVLNWQIGADWRYDPTLDTEVEVRFIVEADGGTRVELEHRGLEAYGEQAEQMKAIFESPDGWGDLLGRYAAATSGA